MTLLIERQYRLVLFSIITNPMHKKSNEAISPKDLIIVDHFNNLPMKRCQTVFILCETN